LDADKGSWEIPSSKKEFCNGAQELNVGEKKAQITMDVCTYKASIKSLDRKLCCLKKKLREISSKSKKSIYI